MAREQGLHSIYSERKIWLKYADRGCLTVPEKQELNYFEELEMHEAQLGDVIKFGYRTLEEIGLEAEERVRVELFKLDPNQYQVFNNLLITVGDGRSTQIDFVVVSLYGIFVIETKNYRGRIFGGEDSRYWSRYIVIPDRSNNKKKKYKRIEDRFWNPIKQNESHIRALSDFLSYYPDITYHNIIAFAESAQLEVDTTTDVVYINDLSSAIGKYKSEVCNKSVLRRISDELYLNRLSDPVSYEEHGKYVLEVKKIREKNSRYISLSLDWFVTLYLLPSIGRKTIEIVQDHLESELHDVDDLLGLLIRIQKINTNMEVPSRDLLYQYHELAITFINEHHEHGITLLPYCSVGYPDELKCLPNYPMMLFCVGNLECLKQGGRIGIIGSTEPAQYSYRCANRFGQICAEKGSVAVSILQEGCNLAAVRGALEKKGKVILVFSSALDYSKENPYFGLINDVIMNEGCAISYMRSAGFVYEEGRENFFNFFAALCTNIISVEVHRSPTTLGILKNGFKAIENLAYLSRKPDQGNQYSEDDEIMSHYGAFPLVDSQSLQEFLSKRGIN